MINIGSAFYELFAKQYWKIVITQTVMWIISIIIKNPTLVDVSWCFGQFLIGFLIVTRDFHNFERMLTFHNLGGIILLTIWLFRLGGFIFYYRILRNHFDARYKKMTTGMESWKQVLFYFFQFHFQGILFTLTSMPLYWLFIEEKREIHPVNYVGVVLAITGLIGEAVADFQLQTFKDNRVDPISILRSGLFKYCRHPNLFFELIFWIGMATFAINAENLYSIFAYFGPLCLWAVMFFLTIPVTTKHMKSKPQYEDYLKETNVFLPFKLCC